MLKIDQYLNKEGWKQDFEETKSHARMGLEVLVETALIPYALYKKNPYVNLNVNVLAAAYPSIQAASGTSFAMEANGFSREEISFGAAVVDWLVYIPIHIGLHYFSKREQFKDENGKLKQREFWGDVGKVYLTQIPSIALFYVLAAPLHYGFMKAGLKAEDANLLSYWGTLVATRALHTHNYWKMRKNEQKYLNL